MGNNLWHIRSTVLLRISDAALGSGEWHLRNIWIAEIPYAYSRSYKLPMKDMEMQIQ